jgi:hypothetical protein
MFDIWTLPFSHYFLKINLSIHQVKLDRTSMTGTMTINSDDPMLSSTMLDVLKKGALA